MAMSLLKAGLDLSINERVRAAASLGRAFVTGADPGHSCVLCRSSYCLRFRRIFDRMEGRRWKPER